MFPSNTHEVFESNIYSPSKTNQTNKAKSKSSRECGIRVEGRNGV